MASLPLEEFVTCQICFELYNEPQSLSCRHTLCKRCVRKLRSGSKIQCPMCQIYSDTKDIKPDFNVVSLIDLYKQQEKETSGEVEVDLSNPKLCHTCKDSEKNVTALCVDCKQFMCKDCEAAHKGIPSLRKHTIKSLDDVATEVRQTLKESKVKLSQKKENLVKKLNKILSEINRINGIEKKSLSLLNKSEEAYVDHVVVHYESLRDKVKQAKEEEREKLKATEKIVNTYLSEITDRMGMVVELIEQKDAMALIETGRPLSAQIIKSLLDTHKDVPEDADIAAHFNVDVAEGSGFESLTAGQVDIRNSRDEIRIPSPGSTADDPAGQRISNYSAMIPSLYENRRCVPLDVPSKKLHLIRDYLWCVGTNIVNVYSKNLQLVKTIQLENVSNVTALTQLDSGKLLVTCSVKKTLQVLSDQGKSEATVTKGCFSDITRHNHMVYVLDYNHCKIYIFRTVGGGLLPSKMFKLKYNNGADCDTLYIIDRKIYVSSWHNNCIYLHNESGDLLSQYGKSGSQVPGLLKGPRICSVDAMGNILIADCGNHRMQVLDILTGTWKVVSLEDTTIGWPYDAVVDEGIRYMWVLDYKSVLKMRKRET